MSNEIALQGQDLLDEAERVVAEIGKNFFYLGQLIYEVEATEVYKERDFGSLYEWTESRLGLGKRTAQNYVQLYTKLSVGLGYGWDQVRHVPYSSLSRVVGLIETKEDADEWLGKVENRSRSEIETLAKNERRRRREESGEPPRPPVDRVKHDLEGEFAGVHDSVDVPFVDPGIIDVTIVDDPAEGERQALHEFKVRLFPEQWRIVEAAMQRAGQLGNSDKPGHMLHLIAQDFVTTYAEDSDGGVAHRLEWHRRNLEQLFGVEIEINVPDGCELARMSRITGNVLAKPESAPESAPHEAKAKAKPIPRAKRIPRAEPVAAAASKPKNPASKKRKGGEHRW